MQNQMRVLGSASAALLLTSQCREEPKRWIGPFEAIDIAVQKARPSLRGEPIRSVYILDRQPVTLREALKNQEMHASEMPEVRRIDLDRLVWVVNFDRRDGAPGGGAVAFVDATPDAPKCILFRLTP
jgi:hypothetical protein